MKKQEIVALDFARDWLLTMGMFADRIAQKLTIAFAPVSLDVEDESAKHEGHAGAQPGGETHFRVRIVSRAFEGVGRVERQRRVYAALAEEMKTQIHALALVTLTPDEAAKSG